jgi:hypothetical protein
LAPLVSADWEHQESFEFGHDGDEYAVAGVALNRPDGSSLSVILQRRVAPFERDTVTPPQDYERRASRSGADMVIRDVPNSLRQLLLRRSTGLMVNLKTSGLLVPGVPMPFSMIELQALADELDTDEVELVFDPDRRTP